MATSSDAIQGLPCFCRFSTLIILFSSRLLSRVASHPLSLLRNHHSHSAFDAACATLSQGSSQSSKAAPALTLLLHALFSSQAFRPQLTTESFSNIFEHVVEETKDDGLVDAVLDVIWSVDAEIDARKELVLAQDEAADQVITLTPDLLDQANGTNLDGQVDAAKQRLADVVRELLVSMFSRTMISLTQSMSLTRTPLSTTEE